MRDSWHLKIFFSLDQDVGFGGQSGSVGDFFGNDKIKFLGFKKLNSWTASYGLTDLRLSPVLYKNYTRRRLSVQQAQNPAQWHNSLDKLIIQPLCH